MITVSGRESYVASLTDGAEMLREHTLCRNQRTSQERGTSGKKHRSAGGAGGCGWVLGGWCERATVVRRK